MRVSALLPLLAALVVACSGESSPTPSAPPAVEAVAPATPVAPTPPPAPAAPPPPSADDPSTWPTFSSTRLGFSIRMPPPSMDSAEFVARDLEDDDGRASLISQPEGRSGPWFVLHVRTIDEAPTSDRRLERFLRDQIHITTDPLGDATFIGGGPMREMYGHRGYDGGWSIQGFDGFSTPGSVRVRSVLAGNRLFLVEVREHNHRPTLEVMDAFLDSLEIVEPTPPAAEVVVPTAP